MKISQSALAKIKTFEGLRLDAYLCPSNVWTIGYGHTRGVKNGQRINEATAERFLREDIAPTERAVEDLGLILNQRQFDALVSFAFNVGIYALKTSTLLRKIRARADEKTIREQFGVWVYSKGKKLNGLISRRAWEANRYFGKE